MVGYPYSSWVLLRSFLKKKILSGKKRWDKSIYFSDLLEKYMELNGYNILVKECIQAKKIYVNSKIVINQKIGFGDNLYKVSNKGFNNNFFAESTIDSRLKILFSKQRVHAVNSKFDAHFYYDSLFYFSLIFGGTNSQSLNKFIDFKQLFGSDLSLIPNEDSYLIINKNLHGILVSKNVNTTISFIDFNSPFFKEHYPGISFNNF
jgi:hypothetical protein